MIRLCQQTRRVFELLMDTLLVRAALRPKARYLALVRQFHALDQQAEREERGKEATVFV